MTNTKGIHLRNDYLFVQLHKFNILDRIVKNFLHYILQFVPNVNNF